MKRKILAMAIMLSLALAMAAVPMVGAAAENDLLLGTGDFETENEMDTWFGDKNIVMDADSAISGQSYWQVPEGTANDKLVTMSTNVSVKPNTGYTLTFYARCGLQYAGRVLIRSLVNGVNYADAENTSGTVLGNDIEYSFGDNPGEEGKPVWQEVKKSFITAPETNSLLIQFYANYPDRETDTSLCLDNITLTEGVENLLHNGEMNVYKEKTATGWNVTVPDRWKCTAVKNQNGSLGAVQENGDWFFRMSKDSNFYQEVALKAGDYKFTVDYFAFAGHAPHAGVTALGNSLRNWSNYIFCGAMSAVTPSDSATQAGKWITWTTFFTIPTDGIYCVGFGSEWDSHDGKEYDSAVLQPANENEVLYVAPSYATVEHHTEPAGNTSTIRGTFIDFIDDGTQGDGTYNIKAVGHYKAKDITATETFALVSAIYKKNKNTNVVSLYDVVVQNGESAPVTFDPTAQAHNSENIMVNLTVPVNDNTYTYEVKSYLWSSVSGMEPVSEAFELTY